MRQLLIFLLLNTLSFLMMGQEKMNDFEVLANGYINQGKTTQAAEFYSKAGYAYWNRGDKKMAVLAFQKAYDIFSLQSNVLASVAVGNNLGIIYMDEERYSNAHTAFTNVLKFLRKTNNGAEIFNALINVGTASFELSSYQEAINNALEALGLAKEMSNLKSLAKCYSLLAECYEKLGDTSNAYKYFELYSSIDKKMKLQEMEDVKQLSAEEITKANENKRVTEIELKIKKGELKLTQDSLGVSERVAYERQMQVELRNEQLKKKEIQLRYEMQIRRNLIFGIILIIVFLLILGFFLRQRLKDNQKLRQQKEEITTQRNILGVQNKKITDSIYYGLRIQQAMLPDLSELQKRFDTFIIYRPKDIVSGDFYWFYETISGDIINRFIALADCTGHGVPGAFMSMIGQRLLFEIVAERKIYQPSEVLEAINYAIRKELNQDNKKSIDGMDVAFCRVIINNGHYESLTFAGAKRSVFLHPLNDDHLTTLTGDRKGVGGHLSDDNKLFTDKTVPVNKGDTLFLYSDGIIDQHNSNRTRYGTTRFSQIITDHRNEPVTSIKTAIENSFDSYTEPEEQRDDITVIGLRLN